MLSAEHERLLREKIAATDGLKAFADEIVAVARTRIRLQVTDEPAGPDETRLGGTAALPAGVPWPACTNGEPQPLIAQLVLRDVAHFDFEKLLPPDGRLLFFHNRQCDAEAVLYIPEGIAVVPHEAPQYPARRVAVSPEISLPFGDLLHATEWGFNWEYDEELFAPFTPEEELMTSALGYSVPVHRPSLDELHDPDGTRLLLQVDSEERAGMMWGDAGRIYFWIREADLRARNFDGVRVDSQCH